MCRWPGRALTFTTFLAVAFAWPAVHASAGPPASPAVTLVDRTQTGGYVEETAFIPSGPYANHIVMTNGRTVYGVPAAAAADASIKPLFDSRAVGWAVPPKGMTYIESERAFAFVEGGSPETLFRADDRGRPLPPTPITYLPEPLDSLHNEGLVHLPPSSKHFPDHLLMVANRFPAEPPFIKATIEVLRRDGTVVAQIVPDAPLDRNYLTAIAVKDADHLLVGLNDQIWTIDFDGHIVGSPVTTPGPFVEGIERLPDGRFVASGADRLYFFDSNLDRLPGDDRDAGIGLGLFPFGITWNGATNEHLALTAPEDAGDYFTPRSVTAMSPDLTSARTVLDLADADRSRIVSGGIDHLGAERRTAVLLWRTAVAPPGQILLVDEDGNEVERIDVPLANGSRSPRQLAYLPRTDQFAIVYLGASRDHKIVLVSRTGELVGEIDLAPAGIAQISALTAFATDDRILVFGSAGLDGGRAVVIDSTGTVVQEFNYLSELDMLAAHDLATVTSGPLAGAFTAVDAFPGFEVVTFRLGP